MSDKCAVGETIVSFMITPLSSSQSGTPLPQTEQSQGSGSQPQRTVAILILAWHVTRPLWATHLACPCLLACCTCRDRANFHMFSCDPLLRRYAASRGLATNMILCRFLLVVARSCAARPLRSISLGHLTNHASDA